MRLAQWIAENMTNSDYAVLTGSSSGIGYEYLRYLSAAKCNVICVGFEAERMQEIKIDFEAKYGNKIINTLVDFRDSSATFKVAEDLAKLSVKILINCAGIGMKGPFEKHATQNYLDVIAVNIMAPIIFTRSLLPLMQRSNIGIVMHVASINGLVPIPRSQVYSATKAFCTSYALATARENKTTNIKFQLVLPGTTKTAFHDKQGSTPQKLVMMPEDVVEASTRNINKSICIPNPVDRLFALLIPWVPRVWATDIAGIVLKKRLGV